VDAGVAEREFEFSARDFERVRRLIRAHAGIALNDNKRNMVYGRLSRRLRARGLASFDAYLAELEAGECAEHEEFVNALTTNLTAFWREPHHFPVLAAHLKRRAAAGGKLDLWCCAASTGEEPYTIAITALQAGVGAQVKVLATDIDTGVLEHARRGVYPAERVAGVDDGTLRRYFLRGTGANAGHVRVRREVAALAEFRRLNLLEARWPVRGPFSAIFCRNVMIYFDKDTQYTVLRRLAALLEPGGLLFAGHSENFALAKDYLRACGRTVYERLPDAVL
jgi:chemotaxis protein methyltransferase CheR